LRREGRVRVDPFISLFPTGFTFNMGNLIDYCGDMLSREEIIGMCFWWIESHNSEYNIRGREG